VRSESDLDRFFEKCRGYFSFFLRELGGIAMTPLEIRQTLAEACALAASPCIEAHG